MIGRRTAENDWTCTDRRGVRAEDSRSSPIIFAPESSYVLIQATYGTTRGMHAKLLEIDPSPPGAPILLALGVSPTGLIGGTSTRGTVSLVMLAPAGGGVVTLTSD